MPFKLKLKKSRQYNVTSKSLFVISVHHLLVLETPTTVDCTLSSESTGQECLVNVCQRLSINQLEFFGLRYVAKDTDEFRWVDLERPLSRQLEKHASSPRLYLRVMYYVISGVSLITDEMARNYYFLQLKTDVIDGRISCDPKQAVILAIYCRQAQYDSHQSERHTVEYLKTLLPFPRHLIEAGLLETLTEEVLQPNVDIQNLTQASAEGLFIAACQQLDGYGQEKFLAKDDTGAEVQLGITVSGIAVVAGSSEHSRFYPWHDISNVVNHKRTFNIECTVPENSVGFSLADADTGRYFWKLCVLQHTFYMRYEQNQNHTPEGNLNLFAHHPEEPYDSRDNLFVMDASNNLYASDSHISASGGTGAGSSVWQTDSAVSSNVSLATSQLRANINQNNWTPAASEYTVNRNSNWGLAEAEAVGGGGGVGGSNASLNNRAHSSSCLDLSNNNNNNINGSQERERLKALLPGYRPAPDYETAVQQKYRTSESELRMTTPIVQLQTAALRSDQHLNMYTGSQPDVHRATAAADAIFGQQLQQQYPDVTQTTNPIYQQHHHHQPHHQQHHMIAGNGLNGFGQHFQINRFNKPPPPYPANRLSSSSTPDLALASHRALYGYRGAYVSGSSPDLVSTRTFLNPQYMQPLMHHPAQTSHMQPIIPGGLAANTFRYRYSQSHIPHGTYENLNFLEPQQQQQQQQQTKTNLLSQKIQKVYEGATAAYRVPPATAQQQQQLIQQSNGLMKSSQQLAHNGSIEPIYENVPLPYHNSGDAEMRDRASSIQSAPGQMRQQQQQQQANIADVLHMSAINIHDRPYAPEVAHRTVAKTSSNPIAIQQQQHAHDSHQSIAIQQQQQQHQHVFRSQTPVAAVQPLEAKSQSSLSQMDSAAAAAINRSQSTNHLDSSQSSTYTNVTTTTADSGISSSFGFGGTMGGKEKDKEKKKRRWGFFGGSKGSLSSDKQKSATLGRDKDKSIKNTMTREEENNLRHRWSTGLPRLPLPVTISKEKLCQILEAKLCDPQLYVEFERIPKRKENASYDCALHEDNRLTNFDPNFLPYDENRVRITPTRDNRLGYVNASHITATVGAKQRFYIVAQSPNGPEALNVFLQCVWEADVYLLVQLSDEVNYVPPTSDKCLEYGQYQVWQEFSQVTDRCITSKLRLYHTQSRRYRSVWHLKYSKWVEQNCPKDVGHFLDFLEELNSVRLAAVNEVPPGHNTNPPVMIHCSEGGGRAGVALSADLLLYTLDHNQDLDIPRVVSQLRHQRDNIIPSLAQYKFIYGLLIHYLKRTRLI